ncbi:endonuclease domain-containing protein [Longispora fulva]|uniref:Very-short-patch-repair endonuclease n=1 Tax=Longispora fulva TaxID=619741 RepID=A0A8J7KMY6_9ACTN|nr:DUF559 domain-containing protein [Longispora fulva]MBG6141034.1 very-short-patch-repair endonuclease [Longispora fulva]
MRQIRAALRVLPARTVLSHETAALVHLLPNAFGVDPVAPVHVTLRQGRARSRVKLIVHTAVLLADEVHERVGLPVTSPARTWLDLAGLQSPRDHLALTDALLASREVTHEELAELLERSAGRRGVLTARTSLALADPLAQSPFESYTRLIMIDAGLRPVAQHEVRVDGARYLLDLALLESRVGVEFDGRVHAGQTIPDLRRQNALHRAGWVLLRYTGRDLLARPGMVRTEILATHSHRLPSKLR